MRFWLPLLHVGLLAVASLQAPGACAQTPAEFYKNRPITVLIGGGVGGGYDVYVRTFIRHATRHIPGNPSFIAKNLPAASGLVAAGAIVLLMFIVNALNRPARRA